MTAAHALLVAAVLVAPTAARAQAFKAFSPVVDVCPDCTTGPPYDEIVLRSGQVVRARVYAENEAFLVLERFGELRAVGRDQVQHVALNPAIQRPAGVADQIVLVDDIVLAGTLPGELKPDADHFEITVPGTAVPLHQAERATVAAIYRAGKRIYVADK